MARAFSSGASIADGFGRELCQRAVLGELAADFAHQHR
jgi:hypothetical protein